MTTMRDHTVWTGDGPAPKVHLLPAEQAVYDGLWEIIQTMRAQGIHAPYRAIFGTSVDAEIAAVVVRKFKQDDGVDLIIVSACDVA